MNFLLRPDPPGTISPAKLLRSIVTASETAVEVVGPPRPHEGYDVHSGLPASPYSDTPPKPTSAPLAVTTRRSRIHLPRISSEWYYENDTLALATANYQNSRTEFEKQHDAKRRSTVFKARSATAKARRTSHRGYFRSQLEHGLNVHVPIDIRADPGATVVVDKITASIYDVYLLRADIVNNVNSFRRLQIVFSPETELYTLFIRAGRVGLPGEISLDVESKTLRVVFGSFRRLFSSFTGSLWQGRYESRVMGEKYQFVELDYHSTVAPPKKLPDYTMVDSRVQQEVRGLMEDMLYGGSRKKTEDDATSIAKSRSAFSAPYEYLSLWTIFTAFKILKHIWSHLESGPSINWKAILRASSRYRSHIPCCTEHDRVPVISSYHALFIELKFLYSLRPLQEIASMLTEIHRRGSLQLIAYKTLAQPLYQAYSSLSHGFRRLTDSSTPEYQELKGYLHTSNINSHHLKLELQEIYRVFLKTRSPNPYHERMVAQEGHGVCQEKKILLWHGTPLDSLLGILDLGLQIRRKGASWTGTMFGNGIYLADASSKSAGFCKHRLSSGEAVLLLCEADVGSPRVRSLKSIPDGNDLIQKSDGRHRCIEGLGKVGPGKWKMVDWDMTESPCNGSKVLMPDPAVPYDHHYSKGCLGFNEYVVYDPSHVVIRYLLRVKING